MILFDQENAVHLTKFNRYRAFLCKSKLTCEPYTCYRFKADYPHRVVKSMLRTLHYEFRVSACFFFFFFFFFFYSLAVSNKLFTALF